jgi:hypothetical protein
MIIESDDETDSSAHLTAETQCLVTIGKGIDCRKQQGAQKDRQFFH